MTKTIMILAIAAAFMVGASAMFVITNIEAEAKAKSKINTYVKIAEDSPSPTKAIAEAFCDEGDIATGGGFEDVGGIDEVQSHPILADGTIADGDTPVGWQAVGSGNPTQTLISFVVCADTNSK